MLNHNFFYKTVREHLFSGSLKQSQVDGMNAILREWEDKFSAKDDRFLAYCLATAYHETDTTMQAIREYGRGKGHEYGVKHPDTGQVYYGRGLVQLTWYANYRAMTKLFGIDFVNEPDLALELENAVKIMFAGMFAGIFTGKKLSQFFGAIEEPVKARAIINGKDKANLIAGYYYKFYSALSHTT